MRMYTLAGVYEGGVGSWGCRVLQPPTAVAIGIISRRTGYKLSSGALLIVTLMVVSSLRDRHRVPRLDYIYTQMDGVRHGTL